MTQAEFKAWAEKNTGLLFQAAKHFFGRDGEEHVAEIYQRTAEHIGNYDPSRGTISTFIYHHARTVRRDAFRRDRRQPSQCQFADYADELFHMPELPIDDLITVDALMPALSEKQRKTAQCLMMGDSIEEIGRQIGASRQYAWQVVKRVREIAREKVAA